MKILIALKNNKELNSELSEHFGHCSFFAIYDLDKKEINYVKNDINHSLKITPVEQILKYNTEIVFTLGAGKRAIKLFNEKNIKLKTGNFKILKEVIDNIGSLEDLNQECEH